MCARACVCQGKLFKEGGYLEGVMGVDGVVCSRVTVHGHTRVVCGVA